jgi:methionyl-tRNA synthetase
MAGQKLSKTLGGTLDIQELLNTYPSDVLRYFLMREIPFERDGDFSEERLLERYNADLANDLGNLLQRVSTLLWRQEDGAIPAGMEPEATLFGDFRPLKNRIEEGYRSLVFHQALAEVLGWVSRLNGYMAEQAPWTNYRSSDTSKARRTLANVVGGLKAAFVWLLPVMPTKAAEGLKQIGVDPGGTPGLWGLAGETSWLFSSGRLGQTRTLFPRILEA